MQEIADLLVMLVAYYATFGIMVVGFGMMAAGSEGAAAAGDLFFVRPLSWLAHQVGTLAIARIIAMWRFLLDRVVDPLILAVERAVIWLATRERGCLRRRMSVGPVVRS